MVSYFLQWQKTFDGTEAPHHLALSGGQLATQLSDVFAAGYQAAIRAVFPHTAGGNWYAFCVSEGRDDMPPTISTDTVETSLVNGAKTWVASADVVSRVIVKVNRGADAFYVDWGTDKKGLELRTGDTASFLPGMNQGVVVFNGVEVAAEDRIDDARVRLFGVLESLYIYLAFVGFVAARGIDTEGLDTRLIELLKREDISPAGFKAMANLDHQVQQLLAVVEAKPEVAPVNWATDKRLIAMYSPMIQKRVQ